MPQQNKPQRAMNRFKEDRRYQAPENETKESYDERRRNYYDHQGANLESREKLRKAGVKSGTPNMPLADYTADGAERRMSAGKKQKKADTFLDSIVSKLRK